MAELFATVEIVAFPSCYREGVPRSLTEAAAYGLPIVTCDAPGCREVVSDGADGLLVPPRDAEALTAAIERLVASPELRQGAGGV
jgi:glycosyltransferase involved in cell wall biosynthesis